MRIVGKPPCIEKHLARPRAAAGKGGISSGANLLGAVVANAKLGGDKTVVTVFADDNKKYLSTHYSKHFEYADDSISRDVELISVKAIKA